MDAIVISDDENVSVNGSDDPDDEPILVQIERLHRKRKRPASPIIIESDDEDIMRPGPSRVSTDREVSPIEPVDLDKVRLPSSDDESDDGLFDSALALRSPNPMIPGKSFLIRICLI